MPVEEPTRVRRRPYPDEVPVRPHRYTLSAGRDGADDAEFPNYHTAERAVAETNRRADACIWLVWADGGRHLISDYGPPVRSAASPEAAPALTEEIGSTVSSG